MTLCPTRLVPIIVIILLGTSMIITGCSDSQSEKGMPINEAEGTCTSTLSMATELKALKFKAMVEHEVYLALDGLKKGQPAEISRSSLLSLLSISHSDSGRRILRNQRMAKPIMEAISNLDFDDRSTKLAALSLYSVLTNDERKVDKTTLRFHLEEALLDASIQSIDDLLSNLLFVDIPDDTCQSKEPERPPCQVLEEKEGILARMMNRHSGQIPPKHVRVIFWVFTYACIVMYLVLRTRMILVLLHVGLVIYLLIIFSERLQLAYLGKVAFSFSRNDVD